MLRKKLFLIAAVTLLAGIVLIVFFMVVPMDADKTKIKLPHALSEPDVKKKHTINNHSQFAAPIINSPKGHNKSAQKVMLLNAEPIVISAFSSRDIQLSFLVAMPETLNVRIEAKADPDITITASQLDFTPSNNIINYRFTLHASEVGKFYIMFHSRIDTSETSIQSAPVGVLVQVTE